MFSNITAAQQITNIQEAYSVVNTK
jgi:hypothetical protein